MRIDVDLPLVHVDFNAVHENNTYRVSQRACAFGTLVAGGNAIAFDPSEEDLAYLARVLGTDPNSSEIFIIVLTDRVTRVKEVPEYESAPLEY